MKIKEFRVNRYIVLKFEKSKINIYINNEKFIQCKFLLLDIPLNSFVPLDELRSIDEFSEKSRGPFDIYSNGSIPPHVEFWGHCSNLQAWSENNYNTNLLHSNIAFPILRKLAKVGDLKAREVFKDEVIKRIESGYVPTIVYLIVSNFLEVFTQKEFEILMETLKGREYILEEKTLDLIWSFKSEYLSVNDLIFLIEHPKIRLFELLIKYGKRFFDKDADYIGVFRQWVSELLRKLLKWRPQYLSDKLDELIVDGTLKVEQYDVINKLGIYKKKINYSKMDEFSILLYNYLR